MNSHNRSRSRSRGILLLVLPFILAVGVWLIGMSSPSSAASPELLTEPFLQLPEANSVQVVWFTEFAGAQHFVDYGNRLEQRVNAVTTKLSRLREDQDSRVGSPGQIYQKPTYRDIWRHQATVTDLAAGVRSPYRVTSVHENGQQIRSGSYTLAPLPLPNQSLNILLTSDHQLMPLTPANLQKVAETIRPVDALFLAGDLVNIPDRASEWFDDNRGSAFFPSLQGRTRRLVERNGTQAVYRGGALIQSAPLFPALGNHEVMGRFSMQTPLSQQYSDAYPVQAAEQLYAAQENQVNPQHDSAIKASWLKNHSFNTDTYQELFSLPISSPGGEQYYAITFGNVRLISLYATNIWRVPSLEADARGKYRERDTDLNAPERWGYGQHLFGAIAKGSPQYEWLRQELNSPAFRQARYRIVMVHHPVHSLGDNIVPAYTDPVQTIKRDTSGAIQSVRYEYPLKDDYLIRDVVPLLEAAGVQLVFYGHSHLWNRFISPAGVHYLESSNVGNSYGAFIGNKQRPIPNRFVEEYPATGDPNGLQPVVPTLAPLFENGQAQPYIASNDISVFSIFNTGTGTVSSYRFDVREPENGVIKFDEFSLPQVVR